MIYNNMYRTKLDLSPAKWIWYPSQRTLANTFALFRKEVFLDDEVISATGYICADSRYLCYVNGKRVQWGPAPSDPRYMEVDNIDITSALKKGNNAICFQVLYYGFSEGTWVAGTPGLIFNITVKLSNGNEVLILSDENVATTIDWSHRPGEFQRWYLRSLQEICDGRKKIAHWQETNYECKSEWTKASVIGDGNIPSVCTNYSDYANDGYIVTSTDVALLKRDIPILKEYIYYNISLAEAGKINWTKDKDNWFLFREPNIFSTSLGLDYETKGKSIQFVLPSNANVSSFLTFELKEQVVGFPFFTIEAPEDTTIEIMTLEGHVLGQNLLLDSGFYCWSRYICHAGENYFEAFDFESVKWLQLNISNPKGGEVILKEVGVRRRIQPFNEFYFNTGDSKIQRLMESSINTIYNAALETVVDGMGRERQQYSGDASHVLIALRYALGDKLLNERFIQTYSTGMTKDGLFLDSWPGVDRLKRLSHRQIDMTIWGNIVDHSIQFVFDCYKYYLNSGNLECIRAPMLAFNKLIKFLMDTCGDGLYPTDDRNSGFIWLDHEAYDWTDHKTKECAINLYIAGMMEYAYVPFCEAFNYDKSYISEILNFAKGIVEKVSEKYWCHTDKIFYDNLPYVTDRKQLKVADRTLAMAILYNYCKDGDTEKSIEVLKGGNNSLKLSYPCNSVWRMWGLAKGEALEALIPELYSIWAEMPSVKQNNTLQEFWKAIPDSSSEWSHIPSTPLVCLYEGILGVACNNIHGNYLTLTPQLKGFCSFETIFYNNGSLVNVKVRKNDNNRFEMFVNSACEYCVKAITNCTINETSKGVFEIIY